MNLAHLDILVADDNTARVEFIRRVLKGAGIDPPIRVAGTLRAYREAVDARPPDFALVNLSLSDGNGADVPITPPEAAPFPVVFITGDGSNRLAMDMLERGALACLVASDGTLAALPRIMARAFRDWKLMQERRRTVEALRQSERRQKAILDTIPDPAWLKDTEGRFLAVNHAWTKIFGRTADEALGRTIADFLPGEHAPSSIQSDLDVVRDGTAAHYEESIVDPQGRLRWFETFKGPIIDDQGAVAGITGIAREITRRRQAEQALLENEDRYRRLFEEALGGGALADAETGIILDCNRAFLELTGYDKRELIGRPQSMLHPLEDGRPAVTRSFDRHRAGKGGELIVERLLTKSGLVKEVEIKATVVEIGGRPAAWTHSGLK
ncbi:MAG: PAS domain S-box protein, partial [bacterium]|nr:PAS domain S-box protein [bacterium]